MAEDEVLMEVIVNERDEVQFYSPADQCKTLYEDKDAMLRTIIEAVKEGLLILPTVKWNEIKSVRFLSNIEKSVEIMTQEVHQETEYETYEIVEESPVDEAVASSDVREEIIIDVGLSSEDIKRSKDESNSEEQDIIESEIIDEDPRSEMVDNSDGNHIPQNVQIIDTTRMGDNEDVEMYEAEEGYVETTYVHDEEIEEETVPTESSIEVVEEHVITSQAENEYRNYEGLGKIYLCSNCPYQSTNTDDIEAHIQEHEASLANGVDSAENGISESDVSKTNISFLNKSQTEKLKEFKRLLQEGTVGSGNNMVQFTKTHPKKVTVAGEMKNGFHQPIETGLRNKTNTGDYVHNENVSYAQENENVEFRNEPSPEEVTLYGEYNEAEHQEETIEEDIPLRESSVIIVGTAEELKEKNECELCGFNARTIWELKSHIRVHTGEMSYVCPQCPFKTNQKNSFQRHVRHLHGWRGSSLPYQCKACDFKTKNKDVFFKHTQIHSAKKIPSIECNICEQVMGNLSELKGHMKLHIGEAPYECFHCGKLTARKLQMRRHMKKHICALEGKGPPYECDSCGYQTVFKSNYMRHLETHELDPPKALICHYCRYVTLDNKVFKEHLREHNIPGSVEAGDILISEETGSDNTHSLSTNEAAETSNHKRKPLREQNSSLESESSTITSPNLKKGSVKDGTQEIIPVSDKKHKKSMRTSMAKKREYIKRLGNITESELRIRRRLDFNIRKAPKESRNGFNVEVRGEILKSKRQLRDFNDYGKVVKTSDLEMSTVLEKESQLDSIFATLRESIQFLKERKNSSDNVATFTIYFKTKEEQDPLEFAESLTDLEAELLSDSNDNDSDNDSLKLDDDLSSSVLLDLDEETEEETPSKTETNRSENGISLGKGNKKKPLVNPGVSNMKLLQNIMLRNEKMKQMRRLKVLRNSTWNASSVRSEPKTSKSRVTVGYSSSDNVEMEEVVVDHNIDSLPSLV